MANKAVIKGKKVVMIEANEMEQAIQKNGIDIIHIMHDIDEIKHNHLAHIETDIKKIDTKVEKIDARLWAIMLLVVGSALANYFM